MVARRRRNRPALCSDGGRPAGVLRAIGGRRRRRSGRRRLGSVLREHDRDVGRGRDGNRRHTATAGHQPGRGVHRVARHRRRGDCPVRAAVSLAVGRDGLVPSRLQPGAACLPRRPGRRWHGHLPHRLGDDEPGLLSADSAAPARCARGARRVLVPGPVRGRVPAGRGRVRDPVVEDRFHDAGGHRRARLVRARRVAGRRLPARAGRLRVQGGPGPAARVAARGAPGRPGRRVGVPVRRGRQAGRVRDRACSRSGSRRRPGPGPAW